MNYIEFAKNECPKEVIPWVIQKKKTATIEYPD